MTRENVICEKDRIAKINMSLSIKIFFAYSIKEYVLFRYLKSGNLYRLYGNDLLEYRENDISRKEKIECYVLLAKMIT